MTPGPAYRPGRELARGGMGAVLDARDQKLGRTVAMKVMLRPNATVEEQQRFLQEARVLGQLAHPNIVPIHDLGTDERGRLFYTMKLVQGVTLHDLLHKLKAGDKETLAKYPLPTLLTVFQKVCDAVAFAHSQGIIHRDLKPQNIMVGEFGEVLVMDWGLAKLLPGSTASVALAVPIPGTGPTGTIVVQPATPARPASTPEAATLNSTGEQATVASTPDTAGGQSGSVATPLVFTGSETPTPQLSGTQLTLDGTVMGTPNYMSPEQADGRIADLDERSDVYSLGGVLFALLTLRPPVEGKDVSALLNQVLQGDIIPPTLATRGRRLPHLPDGAVPEALSAVAMKALALNRDARYRSATELTRDIAAYQGGFATAAERAGALTQLRLFIRRHRGLSAAAALIVLLTAVFITSLAHERDVAERNAVRAEQNERKAVAAGQSARDSEQKARRSADVQRREAARARVLLADAAFLASDLPGMVRALDQCPEDLREQTWEYLAAKRDASLGELRVAGFERPTALAAVPGQPGVFALASGGGDIAFVGAADGAVRRMIRTGRGGIHLLAFAQNGKFLAVARRGGNEVEVFTLSDGRRLRALHLPQQNLHWLALTDLGDRTLLATIAHMPESSSSTLRLWDARTGTQLWEMRQRGLLLSAVAHPAGDRVLVAGSGQFRHVLILDAQDGRERARLDVYPMTLALSADGGLLAVGTVTGELLLVNPATGAVAQRGKIHSASLAALAWLGGRHLLTMGTEGKFADARWTFRLVEAPTLAPRGSFFGLKQGQNAPAWAAHPATGDLLTLEGAARRWRFPVGQESARRAHESEQAWGGEFIRDDRLIARKSFGLALYDERLAEQPMTGQWEFHVTASHPASGQFALARHIRGTAPELKVFAFTNDTPVEARSLPVKALANGLAFDAAGRRLLAVTRDGAMEAFALADGRSLFRREGGYERAVFAGTNIFALAAQAAAGELEYRLERLEAASGRTGATLRGGFVINALAVSPDERLVAFAGGDRYVYFVHVEPKPDGGIAERNFFRAHDGEIGALAFHPTQPVLATASADGSVKLWDHRDAKRPLEFFLGLEGVPIALSFSPDGKRLLVDGQERTTRVFDVAHVSARP